MSAQRISQRYARSFFEIAESKQVVDKTAQDMQTILDVIHTSSDFAKFLHTPVIREQKKAAILHTIFDKKLQALTLQFIQLLVKKGRAPLLKNLAEAFIHRYDNYKGVVNVELLVSKTMQEVQLKSIEKYITNLTHRTPKLKVTLSSALLGGFVLRFDDKQLDKSVATQLRNIQKSLITSVN